MNLLAICHEYPPLGTGAANALSHLLPNLVSLGWNVTLLTSHWDELPTDEEDRGVAIRRLHCGRKKQVAPSASELLRFLWYGRKQGMILAQEFSPAVILAFFSIPAGAIAQRIAQRVETPFVVALRGSDVPGYDSRRFGGMLTLARPWIRAIWNRSSAVVANSQWLAELAHRTDPQLAIDVIPNGVDAQKYAAKARPYEENRPLRVLFIGQLVPRKGVDILLDAVAGLSDYQLDVVGDGPLRAQLQEQSQRLGMGSRVVWHGLCAKDDVVARLAHADVFVLPTDAEGMSNTILEALASGLPVVTTAPGAADIFSHREAGLVVERSASAFRGALLELKNSQVRDAMGERAVAISARFSWISVAKQWDGLLRRVVAEKQGHGKLI